MKCPRCGADVPLKDHGDDCYLGRCVPCRVQVEVVVDNQTLLPCTSWHALGEDDEKEED